MLRVINNVVWSRQKLFVAVRSQNSITYTLYRKHNKLQPSCIGVHY